MTVRYAHMIVSFIAYLGLCIGLGVMFMRMTGSLPELPAVGQLLFVVAFAWTIIAYEVFIHNEEVLA